MVQHHKQVRCREGRKICQKIRFYRA